MKSAALRCLFIVVVAVGGREGRPQTQGLEVQKRFARAAACGLLAPLRSRECCTGRCAWAAAPGASARGGAAQPRRQHADGAAARAAALRAWRARRARRRRREGWWPTAPPAAGGRSAAPRARAPRRPAAPCSCWRRRRRPASLPTPAGCPTRPRCRRGGSGRWGTRPGRQGRGRGGAGEGRVWAAVQGDASPWLSHREAGGCGAAFLVHSAPCQVGATWPRANAQPRLQPSVLERTSRASECASWRRLPVPH